jgi:fructose-specific component phosphotransferase system IIB-like protein
MGAAVKRRIGALKPGYYTRIGAAVRHAAAQLVDQPQCKKLLLVLTDGKPNDVDHYEGRFAVEDTRKAVREARRLGVAVFGITVDASAQSYFPALFGRGGYAIVGNIGRLPAALPSIYRRHVSRECRSMIKEGFVRLQTHRSNVLRYRQLLETTLTDSERQFIERRLSEEQSAIESLANVQKTSRSAEPGAV